jgi:hypothetical protein
VVAVGVGVSDGIGVKKTVGRSVFVGLGALVVGAGWGVRVGGGVHVGGGLSGVLVTERVGLGVGVLSRAIRAGSDGLPIGAREGETKMIV